MRVLSSIELPHWLMIGGAILIAMGFLGLAFTRNKEVATNPDSEPPAPRSEIPPLPRLLDSSSHKETNDPGRPSGASSSSGSRRSSDQAAN
jgi:hypothetical protein